MQNVDGRDTWPLTLPTPTHKYMHAHAYTLRHLRTHGGWRQHWFEVETLAVITECLTCYSERICCCAHIQTLQQMQINNKSSCTPPPVFQTHDARVEWRPRFILYSRRLPGQPKTGGDRPKCGKEVGEGNKLVRKFKEKTLIRCLFVDFWSDFWCVFPPVLTDGPLGERDVVADVPGVAEV